MRQIIITVVGLSLCYGCMSPEEHRKKQIEGLQEFSARFQKTVEEENKKAAAQRKKETDVMRINYINNHPKLDPLIKDKISKGEFEIGWTEDQVYAALGMIWSKQLNFCISEHAIWDKHNSLNGNKLILTLVNKSLPQNTLTFENGILISNTW